jgi:4-diphosphocytidyl-2-C-methyl-D-erythritol kinase
MGGTAYATGRGEVLTPMPLLAGIPLLLLIPEERVSTAAAFSMLQRFSPPLGMAHYQRLIAGDFLSHAAELTNDFEEPVFNSLPQLRSLKTRLLEEGAAWAAMSGSGSTIVGAFRTAADRDAAHQRFAGVRAVRAETI